MKSLGLLLILSNAAFASTVDSHSLPILGTESTDNFQLFTTTTRTEYRTEVQERICYRTVIDGYRRVCDRFSDVQRDPHHGERPGPGPRPPMPPVPPMPPRPPVCHDEPVYRTVPYTCYERVTVPFEVIDHQTVSNVSVNLKNAESVNNLAQCSIQFTAVGDNLSTSTACNEYLAVGNQSQTSTYDRGTKVQNFNFNINLFDKQKILAPLAGGLANLHLDGQTLVAISGDLNVSKNYSLKLFVERRRFLKEDETLINRELNPTEYSFENGLVKIDLNKLVGGINKSKKHKIKLSLDVALPAGTIYNNNVPSTHQESEITVWEN